MNMDPCSGILIQSCALGIIAGCPKALKCKKNLGCPPLKTFQDSKFIIIVHSNGQDSSKNVKIFKNNRDLF